MRFSRRPPIVEMWLGVSTFVLLGGGTLGIEILCLGRRLSLNTVFKEGRQIYGMNFIASHGKFFSLPILVIFGERLFQFTMSRRLMTTRSSRVSNDGLEVLKTSGFAHLVA